MGRRAVGAVTGWLTLVGTVVGVVGGVAGPGAAADAPYTVTTLHFATIVGPRDDQACDVVGDLYVPADASPTHRVPAVLTTNGFGGSKDDQAGLGAAFASRGYVVLSYSGLGFGGSDCKITLDDPDYDGKAASQLVSYLGGAEGIAFTDDTHTTPAPALDVVVHDARDHDGRAVAHDPRVGMVGGSYGGAIQFATAAVDKRVDTLVPLITWNDLSYSLAPNNTSQISPDGVSTVVPGAAKLLWALGFSGLGVVTGAQNASTDPARLVGCPNFADFVCPALVTASALGTLDAGTVDDLRHASVASYVDEVRVPTFLIQGQSDTLFNLNEATATFKALRSRGVPVTMAWSEFGHSGPAAPGELDLADPSANYLGQRVLAWFDHYLQDRPVETGPLFSYFRDWVDYTGSAAPAYAEASSLPRSGSRTLYLSGSALVDDPAEVRTGDQAFTTPVAGVPTSTDPADVLGDQLPLSENDLPGTFASFTTPALGRPLTVVGSPELDLQISSSLPDLVLFAKVLDVDPAGEATIVHNLVAPVHVTAAGRPFEVRLPAFVHRFEAGHRLRLVVAGGSTNYRGSLAPTVVRIATGASTQQLRLPVSAGDFTTPPSIAVDGAARVGSRLTARVGASEPAASALSYTWKSGGLVVGRGESYVPAAADAGRELTVTVRASRTDYNDAVVVSAPVLVRPASAGGAGGGAGGPAPAPVSGPGQAAGTPDGAALRPQVRVSRPAVRRGGRFRVTALHLVPGRSFVLRVAGRVVASGHAPASGTVRRVVRVPRSARAGVRVVRLTVRDAVTQVASTATTRIRYR